MVLGAATYLSRSLARTTAGCSPPPASGRSRCRPPAGSLPPNGSRPAFLAAAYLEVWPAPLPSQARADPRSGHRDVPPPGGSHAAARPLACRSGASGGPLSHPPDPKAWEQVQRFYAGAVTGKTFSVARQRWDRTLRAHLQERLALADARLARNDARTARTLYLEVAEQVRWMPAIRICSTRRSPAAARQWAPRPPRTPGAPARLGPRALPLQCPLPPTALKRLARLAGDQSPAQEALAFLPRRGPARRRSAWNAGRRHCGRRSGPLSGGQGAPADRTAAARRGPGCPDLVHPSCVAASAYWLTRLEFHAHRRGRTGEAFKAEEKLRALARRDWAATDWTWRQGRARLEMLPAGPEAQGSRSTSPDVPEGRRRSRRAAARR